MRKLFEPKYLVWKQHKVNKLEGLHVDEHMVLGIYLATVIELQVDFVMIE